MANHALPLALTRFIGREKEIAEIARWIDLPGLQNLEGLPRTRLLTLTGSGGCGKTRLAREVAAQSADAFEQNVAWIEFAPLSDPARVPGAVAQAFDIRESADQPLIETLIHFIRPHKYLLVFDNCEHLIGACAQIAEALLRACPRVVILATSRESLNLPGEIAWRVPPLEIPDPQKITAPEKLLASESVRLFVDRARWMDPPFSANHRHAHAIAQICARLDGMPLALELAAARVKTLSVEQIAARLDDRFRLLTTGSRTAPTRQQTLRATMDWSFDLLDEPERILIRRLAVFAGGWTLDAAEAICVDAVTRRLNDTENEIAASPRHPIAASEIFDVLSRLVDKSLVIVETRDGATRYRMLETIRQYAREKLNESGELASVQNRHLEYFMNLAEQAEPQLHSAEQMIWFNRLDSEIDNLRTALDWSCHEDRVEQGLRIGSALERFWLTRGYLGELYRRLAIALKIYGADKRTLARGKALGVAGGFADTTETAEISRHLFEESISILRELGTEGKPWLETMLGSFAFSLIHRDMDTVRVCAEEVARLSRESGNIPSLARALLALGNAARAKCDFITALRYFEESKMLHQEIGDRRGGSAVINNQVWCYFSQGDLEKAKELGEQAITIMREMGNKNHFAGGLLRLGIIFQVQGQDEQAESLLLQAVAAEKELGNKMYVALAQMHLGRLQMKRRQFAQAQQRLRESLVLFKAVSGLYFIPHALDSFAFLLAASNNAPRAAQLFGATQTLREIFGTPLPPGYHKEYASYLASTRAQLDAATFDALWNEGRAMSLEQAIEYALTEIEIPGAPDAPAPSPRQIAKEKFDGLTAREREVAALVAQGKTNRDIADDLVLSERTIEGHVGNILNKLGFNARAQIAAWAVEKGLAVTSPSRF